MEIWFALGDNDDQGEFYPGTIQEMNCTFRDKEIIVKHYIVFEDGDETTTTDGANNLMTTTPLASSLPSDVIPDK